MKIKETIKDMSAVTSFNSFFDFLTLGYFRSTCEMYNVEFDINIRKKDVQFSVKYKDSHKQWRKSVRKYTPDRIREFSTFELMKMISEVGANDPNNSNFSNMRMY